MWPAIIAALVAIGLAAVAIPALQKQSAKSKSEKADAARARSELVSLLAQPDLTDSQAIRADQLIHARHSDLEHQDLHATANRALLDSAEALLKGGHAAAARGVRASLSQPLDSAAAARSAGVAAAAGKAEARQR